MQLPKEEDMITNADESKKLPEENPEPLVETKKDETELKPAAQTGEKEEKKPGQEEKSS